MKTMVLFSRLFNAGYEMLKDKMNLEEHFTNNILDEIESTKKADGIFLGNQKLDGDTISSFTNLKFIAKQGSGFDNIDVQTATRLGIPVIISDGVNAKTVAEHVMMLILAASRSLAKYDRAVRNGNFAIRSSCQEHNLEGKTIGLVGYGRIGKAVGEYSKAFDMAVKVYDPFLKEQEQVDIVDSLDELLSFSDIVSIHVPLTDSTKNLFSAETIGKMKKDSILVNCSRGGIVDEKALAEALVSGKLAGAGIDVFASEPVQADNPLIGLDNVVLTPHSAALTKESSNSMSSLTAAGILAVIEGRRWDHLANPEVYRNKV